MKSSLQLRWPVAELPTDMRDALDRWPSHSVVDCHYQITWLVNVEDGHYVVIGRTDESVDHAVSLWSQLSPNQWDVSYEDIDNLVLAHIWLDMSKPHNPVCVPFPWLSPPLTL